MKKRYAALTFCATAALSAVIGFKSQTADAATTAAASYQQGATTVWSSPTVGQTAKHYVSYGQTLTLTGSKTVWGQTWYQTTDGGWVPAQYLSLNPTSTAATTSASSTTNAPTVAGQLTTSYSTGAITVWSNPAFGTVKSYLGNGQTVAYTEQKVVNGATWYHLQQGGWVLNNYTTAGAVSTAVATKQTQTTTTKTTQTQTTAQSQSTQTQTQTQVKSTQTQTQSTQTQAQSTQVQTQTTTTQTNTQSTQTATVSASASGIITYAKQFLGTPYVWGGSTPAGFDCSGFVQYVYAHFGVQLDRVTYSQENDGQVISVSQAQPGDLLFWGSRGNSYHVAIYLGNGQYIHAPQPGESVKIGSVQYFTPSFAVRVLN